MDPSEAAVVIAGIAAVGKPSVQLVASLVERVLGPPADVAGKVLASGLDDFLRRRHEAGAQIILGAAGELQKAEIVPNPVPGRILLPILQHGSLEEDEELRRTWTRLLANAADPANSLTFLPAFPHVLAELSPLEVRIIDYIWHHSIDQAGESFFETGTVSYQFRIDLQTCMLIMGNLVRLNLFRAPHGALGSHDEVEYLGPLYLTTLGQAFIKACTSPRKKRQTNG